MKDSLILDILSWMGAIQILTMYALLSIERIKPKRLYHFFNFCGAALICISCIVGQVWQAAFVEGIWSIMAFVFFLKLCFPRELTREERCLIQFNETNKALQKYEGMSSDRAYKDIAKEFPNHSLIVLTPDKSIPSDFNYDRITFVDQEGIARGVFVG